VNFAWLITTHRHDGRRGAISSFCASTRILFRNPTLMAYNLRNGHYIQFLCQYLSTIWFTVFFASNRLQNDTVVQSPVHCRVCGSKLCLENKRNWAFLIRWGRDIAVGIAGRFGVQTAVGVRDSLLHSPPDRPCGPSRLLRGVFPWGGDKAIGAWCLTSSPSCVKRYSCTNTSVGTTIPLLLPCTTIGMLRGDLYLLPY